MTTTPRTLDWAPHHDPRSRDYPIRQLIPTNAHRHDRMWGAGEVLDQGSEGSCVGMSLTGEALASPVRVDLTRLAVDAPHDPTAFAHYLYGMAQRMDEWAGENYSGTSVNAGFKAARELGIVREWRWAFGLDDVIDAVVWKGPVVIGIPWYEAMYEPVGGVLRRGGPMVGGHALCVLGYRKSSHRLDGAPAAVLLNSWGEDWGTFGLAEIALPDLGWLLSQDGEAAIPTRRSYGR